jgi:nitrate/nitrite transporter NarK
VEWERFCRHAHLQRVRHVHHVPLRSSYHELRIRSREPRYEGMCKQHRNACPRLIFIFFDQLWHLFLTQAILVGIGSSMLYYPVISLTPVFFDRHRGFAMGIAMAGSGAGGLVFAPVTQSLLARYGAPVTLRVLGAWNFVVCVALSFVIRPHPAYQPIRPSLALAKRGTFIFQVRTTSARVSRHPPDQIPQLFAAFFQAAGNIIPLYYLATYSTYVLGVSPATASMLLAVNNGVNSVARVAMGLIADYVGRQNTLVGCVRFRFFPPQIIALPSNARSLPPTGRLLCPLSDYALDSCITGPFPRFRGPLWYGFRGL